MKRVPFQLTEAPHGPIRGDVYLPDDARGTPVVVACHGFKGFKDWGFWPEAGRRFAAGGLVLVAFNFSGCGIGENPETFTDFERFEHNTIGKELEDLGLVLDAVTHRQVEMGRADTRKIALVGHSRGGSVALVRASRDPRVRAVATWAAVASFTRYDEAQKELWRRQGYLETENTWTGQVFRVGVELLDDLETHADVYDPTHAAARLRVPLLVVHGTRDETVPVDEAEQLARAAGPGLAQTLLVEGADHTFGVVHPFKGSTAALDRVLDRTMRWIREVFAE